MKQIFCAFICLLICVCGEQAVRSTCVNACQDNWIRFQGSCYFIGYDLYETFVEAAHFCRQHSGHLIHINSELENKFITSFLKKTRAPTGWIGLNDIDTEGVWRWYDDNSFTTYTNWYPHEPKGSVRENCAVIHGGEYLWQDYPCSSKFLPICEREMNGMTEIVG